MLEQISFCGTLRLRSDLHIGTGETELLSTLLGKAPPVDPNQDPDVALVVRDGQEYPIIPGTALKGALRKATIASLGTPEAERLFGAIKHTEWDGVGFTDSGQTGVVWLRFARMTQTPAPAAGRPFPLPSGDTVVTTHVAIDRAKGVAADRKLFHVERVPDGAAFEFRGVYLGSRADAERDLPRVLGALADSEGLGLGADGKQGAGRVALEPASLTCTRRFFDIASGKVEHEGPFTVGIPSLPAPAGAKPVRLRLFCCGPYLTVDPDPAHRPDGNTIPAARRNDITPLLPASSLLGVLRQRAAWLAAADGKDGGDNVERILQTGEDPRTLTRTERLFGVAGWRGLLRLVELSASGNAACERLTSVVIDRFSGATLDSALYAVEAFSGVTFEAVLRLDRRSAGRVDWPSDEDVDLFQKLIDDLCEEGAMLGYGVNRGFGWFEVTKT